MSKTFTEELTIGRLQCGMSCGWYGALAFEKKGENGGTLYGPSMDFVDAELGQGARIRITVEVLKDAPVKLNPWMLRDFKQQVPRYKKMLEENGFKFTINRRKGKPLRLTIVRGAARIKLEAESYGKPGEYALWRRANEIRYTWQRLWERRKKEPGKATQYLKDCAKKKEW